MRKQLKGRPFDFRQNCSLRCDPPSKRNRLLTFKKRLLRCGRNVGNKHRSYPSSARAETSGARPTKNLDEHYSVRMKKLITVSIAIIAGATLSAAAADAKATYEKSCAKCHGAEGKGDTKMGQKLGCKDYSDAKVQAELKDDAATKAIKEGLNDKEGKVLMKPAEGLSDSEIKDLVAYFRHFKK